MVPRLLLLLALAGCASWSQPDPFEGNKPGSFQHLVELKQQGKKEEFFQRVREIRTHAAWLRDNGHPGRAAAVEARLKEILEN